MFKSVKRLIFGKKEKVTEYTHTNPHNAHYYQQQALTASNLKAAYGNPNMSQSTSTISDDRSTKYSQEFSDTDSASTDDREDSFDKEFKTQAIMQKDLPSDMPIHMLSGKCYNNPGALHYLHLVFRRCDNFTPAQLDNLGSSHQCLAPSARYMRIQFIKCLKLNDADLANLGKVIGSALGHIEYMSIEVKENEKFTQRGLQGFLMAIYAGQNELKYLRIKVRRCRYLGEKNYPSLKYGIQSQWPGLQELVFSFNKKQNTGLIKSLIMKQKDDNQKKVMEMAEKKVHSLGLKGGSLYGETTTIYFNRVFSNKCDSDGKPIGLKVGDRQI